MASQVLLGSRLCSPFSGRFSYLLFISQCCPAAKLTVQITQTHCLLPAPAPLLMLFVPFCLEHPPSLSSPRAVRATGSFLHGPLVFSTALCSPHVHLPYFAWNCQGQGWCPPHFGFLHDIFVRCQLRGVLTIRCVKEQLPHTWSGAELLCDVIHNNLPQGRNERS